MWPILIGIGAYLIAQGVQDGIDENRKTSLPKPPARPELSNNIYDELPCDGEPWPEDDHDDY